VGVRSVRKRGPTASQIAASLQREMKSNVTAEAFAEQHGPALLQWLQINTVECACTTPFGPDENLQRGTIDLTTSLACRRCYVPLGLHDVLDHKSGLGLSINSIAAAGSDWDKMKYGLATNSIRASGRLCYWRASIAMAPSFCS